MGATIEISRSSVVDTRISPDQVLSVAGFESVDTWLRDDRELVGRPCQRLAPHQLSDSCLQYKVQHRHEFLDSIGIISTCIAPEKKAAP